MNIPVVLLAGGLGTRLREETDVKPKPMVDIGGFPIIWHIMKSYASFGCKEFVICLGYKGDVIKDFFRHYHLRNGSLTVELGSGSVDRHEVDVVDGWTVHLLETGADTMTGGRIKRAAEFLGDRRFMATYGDGVSNIDIGKLLEFHERGGREATISAVRPPARFGGLVIDENAGPTAKVAEFAEKPQVGEGWINGGFMVFEPGIAGRIANDATILEREPLEGLARDGQLSAFLHDGFWQCMDTVRDVGFLRDLWVEGSAPWKSWR